MWRWPKPNTLWLLALIDIVTFLILVVGDAFARRGQTDPPRLFLWDFLALSFIRALRIIGWRLGSLISIFVCLIHIAFADYSEWCQTFSYVFTIFFSIFILVPNSWLRRDYERRRAADAPRELEEENENGGDGNENGGENGDPAHRDAEIVPTTEKIKVHWSRLISLGTSEKNQLIVGCIVLFVRLPCSMAIPHFVVEAIHAGSFHDPAFHSAIGCLIIAGVVDSVLDFFCVFLFARVQQRIVQKVRNNLYENLLVQEITMFDVMSSGDLLSRLTADTAEMANDLSWVFRWVIEGVVRVVGVAGYMIYFSPRLAAVALTLVPMNSFLSKKYSKWLQKNQKQVQDALADSNSCAGEAINGIRTVKMFGAEDYEHEKYAHCNKRYYKLNVKQGMVTAGYYSVIYTFLMNFIVQVSLVAFGVYLSVPQETLVAFMLYRGQLQEWVSNLLNSYTQIVKGAGASQRVFYLLERKARVTTPGSKICDVSPTVTFDKVAFTYKTRPEAQVLKSVSFTAEPGEVVAIVGRSGSGKSTMFNLLLNLYEPTSGQIYLDDIPVRLLPRKFLLSKVTVVSQEPLLFAGSIMSNILYNGVFSEEECRVAAKDANAMNFIDALPDGFNTEVGEKGIQLSGGQKQRIAIARAIVRKPAILLLDEATSSLDSESEGLVQFALEKAMRGRTTLVIAHRLSTVRDAGKIIVLGQGDLIERGTHGELMTMKEGHYRMLVEKQLMTNEEKKMESGKGGE